MASYLYPCRNGCGKMVRFVAPRAESEVCEPCVRAIVANEESAKEAVLREEEAAALREEEERESARSGSISGGRSRSIRGR